MKTLSLWWNSRVVWNLRYRVVLFFFYPSHRGTPVWDGNTKTMKLKGVTMDKNAWYRRN